MSEKPTFPADVLEFREIAQAASPEIIDALIAKEAVHPATSRAAFVANRFCPAGAVSATAHDKHCFALFAPGRTTPEVAVFVKLLHLPNPSNANLPGNINTYLNTAAQPTKSPNTAIFYTITNAAFNPDGSLDAAHPIKVTRATDGSTAGEHLIKCVASHLQAQGIQCFSTLSPLRKCTGDKAQGFAQWLETAWKEQATDPILTPHEAETLKTIAKSPIAAYHRLAEQHTLESQTKPLNAEQALFVRQLITDLAVAYLAEAKSESRGRIAKDPVANFHLSNGGYIGNIHALPSNEQTISDAIGALGIMVNYRYDLSIVDSLKEAYNKNGNITLDEGLRKRHTERMANLVAPEHQIDASSVEREAPIAQIAR